MIDGQPFYIGRTTQLFSKRMYGYQNPGSSQSTNVRNNDSIRSALQQGRSVEVYCINLAAGLEDNLIRELTPPWNGGKVEASNGDLVPTEPESERSK